MRTKKSIKAADHVFCLTNAVRTRRGNGVVIIQLRAFTLIELLIVVAIIAILAAIAVPNFLEAQTRAKVARVQADMRTIHTAIETYRVDNNRVPVRRFEWNNPASKGDYLPEGNTKIYDPANTDADVGLHTVTTPISYLSSIPPDVFNTPVQSLLTNQVPGASTALDYWDDQQLLYTRRSLNAGPKSVGLGKMGFALLSVGPDKYIGMLNNSKANYPDGQPDYVRSTIRHLYDATNGTTSAGNVYRFSDNLQQNNFFPI